jgi:hypothetical protein
MDFEPVLDWLLDAWNDTWLMLPLMYVAFLIIEYFERRPNDDDSLFFKLQKYGPLFGAAIGLLPQCGFSVLAAMLYTQNYITAGTLIAVFIATSDEAIPVLLAEPGMLGSLGILLVLKFIAAVLFGWLADKFIFRNQKIFSFDDLEEDTEEDEQVEEDLEYAENQGKGCSCCYPQYPIWLSSLLRTAKIYFFVFVVTFIMNMLIGLIGEHNLEAVLLTGSVFQPAIAALIGFIPNCAATVVLCQLYAQSALSFASLLAGLITNAGLGLLVLFQYGEKPKQIFKIMLYLFISALLAAGVVILITPLFG